MKPTSRRRDFPGYPRELVTAVLLTLATAAGCVSTPTEDDNASGRTAAPTNEAGVAAASESALTPAEQRLRQQSRAFQRTVWEGGLVGATAGSLLGAYAVHGLKGLLTTGAAGGASGSLAGAYVARKQKEFASAEDQLDSMIADVRESNRKAETLIASAKEVIAEDRRRIAAVEQGYRAGQATEAELAATRKRIAANRAVVRDAAKGAREQHAMFSGAERSYRAQNPSVDTDDLRHELEAYRQQISTLDGLAESITLA